MLYAQNNYWSFDLNFFVITEIFFLIDHRLSKSLLSEVMSSEFHFYTIELCFIFYYYDYYDYCDYYDYYDYDDYSK